MRIDAHQHFWNFDPLRDAWITEDMKTIRRDFLPADLESELNAAGIHGSVAVQADQSEAETGYLVNQLTGEPVNLPSNMSNGYGYFTMHSSKRVRVDMNTITPKQQ